MKAKLKAKLKAALIVVFINLCLYLGVSFVLWDLMWLSNIDEWHVFSRFIFATIMMVTWVSPLSIRGLSK